MPKRVRWGVGIGIVATLALGSAAEAIAEGSAKGGVVAPDATWQMTAVRNTDVLAWSVYVESEPVPGRPAFRIETAFDVSPELAARTLMASMADGDATTRGERRTLLERTPDGALVHTYVDLPFMFADRELVVRIMATRDDTSGVHRIDWVDANEHLPPPDEGVLRLRTEGYWEFRPDPVSGTLATYVSRAEVGGSLPASIGDRLMRGQAEDAVERLARLLRKRRVLQVAAPPPE